jgi:outer membrane protein assembly factor BamD
MDDVLIGIGDAYEAQATIVRGQKLPEAARVKLLQEYDGKAANFYRQVVILHSAAPHVEDAKERLAGMNLPVPTPTAQQAAASEELEGSRAQYNLQKRLAIFLMHRPNTVTAAQSGIPSLDDPPPTVAPTIVRTMMADYRGAFNPNAPKVPVAAPVSSDTAEPVAEPAAPAGPVAAPSLSDVPAAGEGAIDSSTHTMTVSPADSGSGARGTGVGIEIVSPAATGTPASDRPAATGAPDPNYGIVTPKPLVTNTADLPPAEKPAVSEDQINDVTSKPKPVTVAATDANGKKKKTKAPAIDKTDESSSKKKPKKGIDKLNPF